MSIPIKYHYFKIYKSKKYTFLVLKYISVLTYIFNSTDSIFQYWHRNYIEIPFIIYYK